MPVPAIKKIDHLITQDDARLLTELEDAPEPGNNPSESVVMPAVQTIPTTPITSTSLIREIEAMTEAIRKQDEIEASTYMKANETLASPHAPETH